MEKNAYQILAELYDYVADPKRPILNTTDREHIAVTIRTMLVLYQDDLDAKTTANPSKNLEEARRPVRSSQDKRNWIERQMGKFMG